MHLTRAVFCKITFLAVALLPAFGSMRASAQSVGDYRSATSGNWGATATWQTFNGISWVAAVVAPTSASNVITIRNGHTVTVAANVTADQIVIDAGGKVVTTKVLTVANGAGVDLQVNGILQPGDNVVLPSASSAVFGATGRLTVNNGDFDLQGTSTATFQSGSVATINGGKLKTEQSSVATFSAGSTLENWATLDLKDSSKLNVYGTFVEHNTTQIGSSVSVLIGSGGVYQHARDGGNLLKAGFVTWASGSTCLVTGVTGGLPGELDQNFYNFTWNAPGQNKALNLDRKLLSIAGSLTVVNTGGYLLSWQQDHDDPLNVGANYVQSGGVFTFTDGNGIGTMAVAGDLVMSGGTLLLTAQDGAPTLTVAGDFDLSGGTISETGTGSGTITLNGSTNQSITASGSITNSLAFKLDNAAGATLATSLKVPGALTVTTGTLNLASKALTVAGNLSVAGDLTNPALMTFDGSSNQTFTYAPGTFSASSIKVNKSGGNVVLSTDLSIAVTATLANGNLLANGNDVTLAAGATLLEGGGSFVGTLNFSRYYALDADGWRMVASPLAGVTYSSLNASFHTQGGPWANVVDAESNLRVLDFVAQDWLEVDGSDAPFTESLGYIFYMFADDENGDDILPATWSVTGTTQSGAAKSLPYNTGPSDSWSLVGNPLTSNLDWDDVVANSTNLGNTYATWDPSLTPGGGMTGYRYYNSASGVGDAGRYVPPFQSFMAQATGSSASLSFESSEAANAAAANYFGKLAGRELSPHVRLVVEGQGVAEMETYLIFDEGGAEGDDPYDVQRLRPIGRPFVTLVISNDEGAGLAFEGRSMASGIEEYGICVAASNEGWYELTLPTRHRIPDSWSFTLFDAETGDLVDLDQHESYTFRVDGDSEATGGFPAGCGLQSKPRFRLRVVDSSRVDGGGWQGAPPPSIRLNQNYPNPFVDSTTIRYGVARSGYVRLDVFDLLGRRVATLHDGVMDAGWHDAQWTPRGMASGAYIYRLVTPDGSKSAILTLRR